MNNLVEVVLQVIFLLFGESAQPGQEKAVKMFHLAITLRVVWRCAGVGDPTELFKPLE